MQLQYHPDEQLAWLQHPLWRTYPGSLNHHTKQVHQLNHHTKPVYQLNYHTKQVHQLNHHTKTSSSVKSSY